MERNELAFAAAYELRELLDSREVSSVELTEMFLRRIEELNPILNAYLTVCGDEAMESARLADKRIGLRKGKGQGKLDNPLLGIPVSIKDLELTKGVRSTMGSLAYRNYVPEIDSLTSERVRQSGAVILGKTNTPEFGLLGTTENRLGDACRNPWNIDRTSGGRAGARRRRWRRGCARWRRGATGEGRFGFLPASAGCTASSRRWGGWRNSGAWAIHRRTSRRSRGRWRGTCGTRRRCYRRWRGTIRGT